MPAGCSIASQAFSTAQASDEGGFMAKTLWKRIVKGVNSAILERDRAELRAMDTLLATVEKKRRRPTTRRVIRRAAVRH